MKEYFKDDLLLFQRGLGLSQGQLPFMRGMFGLGDEERSEGGIYGGLGILGLPFTGGFGHGIVDQYHKVRWPICLDRCTAVQWSW